MAELCGTILSGDIPVAEVRNGVVTVTNARLAPLYFRRSQDAGAWLSGRAIDSHRANSRLLKKALRLAERDDISTVLIGQRRDHYRQLLVPAGGFRPDLGGCPVQGKPV